MATNKNEAARRIGAALKGQGIPEQRPGEPRDPTPNAQVVLKRRYLAKDREGNVLEDTNGMFRRVARNLAQADLNYGADEQARQGTEDRFYAVMRSFDLLPNSPTLMNAGRELQQLSACFVLPVEDSLEDIFNGVKQTALIHKSGGGTGFAFSRLRPEGDTVGSTGGVASGPVSFIRAYDTATDVVKQGGTRRGANMGILDVTHPDILKFISAKESGDELQNFNISVAVSDDFMERVKASEDYDLVNPRTGETAKRLNAKEVFELIVDMAWKTGDPGLVFLDEVNRGNPNPQLGRIESTNPCVTGDTVVATSEGPRTVKSLIGREFKALVDGAEHRSTRQGFFPAGHKPVLRITLQAGQQLTLTGNHPVRRISDDREEWVRADLVKTGDALRIHDHSSVQARQASETFRRIGEHGATTALTTRTEVESNDGPHRAGRVVSIDDAGTADVYDASIPGPNVFDANGLYIHNCGEQPLLPYESCNLASVNLANMTKQEHGEIKIDWDRLQETVGTGVHLLDNVIDMNRYPIPEIERMTMQTRRIGLGVMGLADLLVQLGIRYDSQEALEATGEVMAYIHEMTHMASGMLAQKRDPFPAWSKSIYGESDPPRTMRNSAPTTIAPTGTISIIAGTSSGIEPLFALAYVRNVMDKTKLVEVNPVFSLVARNEGFYSEELMEQLVQTGTLEGTKVPEWVKEVFRTSHDIDPQWHVLMQAAVQKHTDNAVSKTINFPHDATREEIATACMTAYDLKCKGITVYRDGSKDQQVLSTGQTKQAGSEAQGDTVRAEPNGHVTPRQRPRSTRGVTERVRTGHGNMYVTINFDDNDEPFEVFGNLGKAGGCDSAQLEAISRLASLALRSGIEPSEILDQIRGITCCPAWDDGVPVRSSPDALALALERYTKGWPERNGGQDPEITQIPLPVAQTTGSRRTITRLAGPKCPDCNTQVMFQEGCPTCPSCGWSRCE